MSLDSRILWDVLLCVIAMYMIHDIYTLCGNSNFTSTYSRYPGYKAGLSGNIGEKVRLSVQGGHGTVLPGQSGLNIGLSEQTGHHDNGLSGHGGQHAGLSGIVSR
jgi:hypothetical protein